MARIVLLKGQSQYNVLRIFIDYLGKAFKQLGDEVFIIDLMKSQWTKDLQDVFSQACDFAFAFNCIGVDLEANNELLFNLTNTAYVGCLVDHPIYHLQRINTNLNKLILTCVDYSHIEFLCTYYPLKRAAFLPHGGSIKEENPKDQRVREIDVLFGGSFKDPNLIRNEWLILPKTVISIMDEAVEYLLANPDKSLEGGFKFVLQSKNFYGEYGILMNNPVFLQLVDGYVRSYRRYRCIEELIKSGIEIDFYGSLEWKKNPFEKYKNFRIHNSVGFNEMLSLMENSKVVLNVLPNFSNGSHERIFTSMLQGAISVTDKNQYLESQFNDEEDILFYSWDKIELLPAKIKDILAYEEKRNYIALNGMQKAKENHTWLQRAKKIKELVEISNVFKTT